MVAFCAPSGTLDSCAAWSGVKRMVDEVNGRVRRWKNEVMAKALSRPMRRTSIWVVGFRMAVGKWFEWKIKIE